MLEISRDRGYVMVMYNVAIDWRSTERSCQSQPGLGTTRAFDVGRRPKRAAALT